MYIIIAAMKRFQWMALLFCLIGLVACANANVKHFESLQELRSEMEAVRKSGITDPFWSRVLSHHSMPIVFGKDAILFWRGPGESVEWRGDFSSWEATPETPGKRLGNTNIWYYEISLPPDARLDYKIVVNGKDWSTDPLNPYTQLGGFGPNSELRMPDYKPASIVRREGILRGKLSEDLPFQSKKLGYTVNYRVYVPADSNSKELPVLYVTDGSDYYHDEMGSLVIILDNLIADRSIVPILAVFIDPWDRKNNVNRRDREYIPTADGTCTFCEFVVEELIPTVEQKYPAGKSRQHRAILGTSWGGLNATFMGMRYGSLFGLVGIQSPAFRRAPWVITEIAKTKNLPSKAFINTGTFEEGRDEGARALRDALGNRVEVKYVEVNDGHSWGQWRALLDDMLIFFFGS